MNKSIISIVIAASAILAIAYFWNRGPVIPESGSLPDVSSLSPEDAEITQELRAIESVNLDKEFQDIDAELGKL